MPSSKNPKKTNKVRALILSTAAKHFAEKGFSGARVDEIAADAGVNKATLYYQVGKKEALYDAVFSHAFRACFEIVKQAVEQQDPPTDKLRTYVTCLGNVMAHDYPHMANLIMREVASGGTHLSHEALGYMAAIRSILGDILALGQQQGLFREANVFMVHMMVVGSLNFIVAGEGIRHKFMQAQLDNCYDMEKLVIEDATEDIANMLIHSLLKCPSS